MAGPLMHQVTVDAKPDRLFEAITTQPGAEELLGSE
jgi:hypothetical protein